MSRKPRKCRICKKRPVWTGGDVKNPGPVCKKCYHQKVGPDRNIARKAQEARSETRPLLDESIHDDLMMDSNYYYWHFVRDEDD